MMFADSVVIAAPAAEVFEVYADVERWPEWTASMTTVRRLDSGQFGIGSAARIKQPRLPEVVWTVTDFQPGRSFTWVARSPGVLSTARHNVDNAEAGCLVRMSVQQQGPVGLLIGSLSRGLTKRYLALEAAGLKRLCEA
jgi:uncharacterized protein YndB with AHSA1/START domain